MAHICFYFDYQGSAGAITDDHGEELPSFAAARDAAMRYLAEGVRDHSASSLAEKPSVHVRTKDGPIMTVSATIEVVAATPIGKATALLTGGSELHGRRAGATLRPMDWQRAFFLA